MPERKIQVTITGSDQSAGALTSLDRNLKAVEQSSVKTSASVAGVARASAASTTQVTSLGQAFRTLTRSTEEAHRSTSGFMAMVSGVMIAMAVFQTMQLATGALVAGTAFYSLKQQAEIAFTSMIGDAGKAKAMIADMVEFAARTPFEMPQLIQSTQLLMGFGFKAQEVRPLLVAIGDAASGLGRMGSEGINRIVIALGQMLTKSKVQSQEMMQLTEAGIPAWDILAKKIGVSTSQLVGLVESGVIPARKAIFALVEGMEERFPNMMEKQSRSLQGLFSTIKDYGRVTFETILRPALDWLTETGLPKAIEKMQKFTATVNELGFGGALGLLLGINPQMLLFVAAAVAGIVVLPSLISLVGGLAGAMLGLTSPLKLVGMVMGVLAVAWALDWNGMRAKIDEAVSGILGTGLSLTTFLGDHLGTVLQILTGVIIARFIIALISLGVTLYTSVVPAVLAVVAILSNPVVIGIMIAIGAGLALEKAWDSNFLNIRKNTTTTVNWIAEQWQKLDNWLADRQRAEVQKDITGVMARGVPAPPVMPKIEDYPLMMPGRTRTGYQQFQEDLKQYYEDFASLDTRRAQFFRAQEADLKNLHLVQDQLKQYQKAWNKVRDETIAKDTGVGKNWIDNLLSEISSGFPQVTKFIKDFMSGAQFQLPAGALGPHQFELLPDAKAATDDWKKLLETLRQSLLATNDLGDTGKASLDRLQASVSLAQMTVEKLKDALSQAKDKIKELSGTPILGEGQAEQRIFNLQQKIHQVQLKIATLELTRSQTLKGMVPSIDKNKDALLKPYNDQLNILNLQLQKATLEKDVKFDPLTRKIKAAVKDRPAEMPFDTIMRGIKDATLVIADLTPKLDAATLLWKGLQYQLKDVEAQAKMTTAALSDTVNAATPPPLITPPVGVSPTGFATGGSFLIGGTGGVDSRLVQFMGTPGERVDITPRGQGGSRQVTLQMNAPLIGQVSVSNEADEDRLIAKVGQELRSSLVVALAQG